MYDIHLTQNYELVTFLIVLNEHKRLYGSKTLSNFFSYNRGPFIWLSILIRAGGSKFLMVYMNNYEQFLNSIISNTMEYHEVEVMHIRIK